MRTKFGCSARLPAWSHWGCAFLHTAQCRDAAGVPGALLLPLIVSSVTAYRPRGAVASAMPPRHLLEEPLSDARCSDACARSGAWNGCSMLPSCCSCDQCCVLWHHAYCTSSDSDNNSQSSSWSIALMGGGALRCVCGRRQPGQLRLERCCGWLFHHMGRKRVPVSYGSNRKRVAECCVEEPTARNLNRCFALVLSSAATRPTFSGWIPTWPITTSFGRKRI